MKKTLLIIIALFTISASYSQTHNKVYKAVYIKYINGEWVDDIVRYPQDLYVTINGSKIKINNQRKDSYVTYGNYEKSTFSTHDCYSWSCLDKDGNDCVFMMKKPTDDDAITIDIFYPKKGYGYEYITE